MADESPEEPKAQVALEGDGDEPEAAEEAVIEVEDTEAEKLFDRIVDGSTAVPVLPLRNTVLFPRAVAPIRVGRPKSLALLQKVMSEDRAVAGPRHRGPSRRVERRERS